MTFLIMDPPAGATSQFSKDTQVGSLMDGVPKSTDAALYFPYLSSSHPVTGDPLDVSPGGFVGARSRGGR